MPTRYPERDAILLEMGFRSYRAYQASDLWKRIKADAALCHGDHCFLCRRKGESFHHLDYNRETLEGSAVDKVIPLCRRCHSKVERKGDGLRSPEEVGSEYARRRERSVRSDLLGSGPTFCQKCGRKIKRGARRGLDLCP
jgi:hypothetical protein